MKNILIIGTGGTIAGVAETSAKTAGYKSACVSIEDLVRNIPEIDKIANIKMKQFCQIDSSEVTQNLWLELSKYINEVFESDNVDGIVITHGTDTMEETAYFLNLTVKSKKPVILTGSMLPSTSVSADGPINIYNSIVAASSDNSISMGVMICMNQKLISARYATKSNTTMTDTFKGMEQGILGYVQNGNVEYFQKILKRHTYNSEFDISNVSKLPKVEILYQYAGADQNLLDYMIKEIKPDGIVFAGMGDGNLCNEVREKIRNKSDNLIIARASRTGDGIIIYNGDVNDDEFKTVTTNNLNPQKARILLMISIANNKNIKEIQIIMNTY